MITDNDINIIITCLLLLVIIETIGLLIQFIN